MDKGFCSNPRRESKVQAMPLLIGIPITTKCNLGCTHCLRNSKNQIASLLWDMSIEQATNLSNKLKDRCKFINLSAGYGEPFLNNDIKQIFKIFHQANLSTIVYTNGLLLNKELLKDFFSDYFIVSIDLFHYKNMNDLLTWFNNFLSIADALNYSFTDRLIVACTIDSNIENYDLIENLCEIQNFYPEIFIEFHWRMLYDDKLDLGKEAGYLELKKKYSSSHIEFPTFLRYKNNHCKDLWRAAYFDHNGNFRNCCVFYDSYEKLNIYDMSLEEIWASEKLRDLRYKWRKNGGFEKCKQCPIGYGNVCEWR